MSDLGQVQGGAAASTGWRWILVFGILLILGGLMALANPVIAGIVSGVVLGWMLIVYGVLAIFTGSSALSRRARVLEIVLGILGIIAGVMVLFNPVQGAASLAWAMGLWLLVSGVSQIVYASRMKVDRGWRLFLGVLDIILGGYLLFSGPVVGFVFVAVMFGLSFLFRGIFLVWLAMGIRKLTAAR